MVIMSLIHAIYVTTTTVLVTGVTDVRMSAIILHTTPRIVHVQHTNKITAIGTEAPSITRTDKNMVRNTAATGA